MYRHYVIKDSLHNLEFKADGKSLTYQWDDKPVSCKYTLRSDDSYDKLIRRVFNIRHEYSDNPVDWWGAIDNFLRSDCIYEFVVRDVCCDNVEPRSVDEIYDYLAEAYSKVWLMKNCCIPEREPMYGASRNRMENIIRAYPDIHKNGYTAWECGYWNGILGALRWVLQEEKDFLDT